MFRLNSINSMAYLLDINDPTKMYTKTIDSTGQPIIKSYTLTEDAIKQTDSEFVTVDMLEEILQDKLEKALKKQFGNGRSRNNHNKNREVDTNE